MDPSTKKDIAKGAVAGGTAGALATRAILNDYATGKLMGSLSDPKKIITPAQIRAHRLPITLMNTALMAGVGAAAGYGKNWYDKYKRDQNMKLLGYDEGVIKTSMVRSFKKQAADAYFIARPARTQKELDNTLGTRAALYGLGGMFAGNIAGSIMGGAAGGLVGALKGKGSEGFHTGRRIGGNLGILGGGIYGGTAAVREKAAEESMNKSASILTHMLTHPDPEIRAAVVSRPDFLEKMSSVLGKAVSKDGRNISPALHALVSNYHLANKGTIKNKLR